jgi:hypothetical protein
MKRGLYLAPFHELRIRVSWPSSPGLLSPEVGTAGSCVGSDRVSALGPRRISQQSVDGRLALLTTTSALGRSRLYDRLTFRRSTSLSARWMDVWLRRVPFLKRSVLRPGRLCPGVLQAVGQAGGLGQRLAQSAGGDPLGAQARQRSHRSNGRSTRPCLRCPCAGTGADAYDGPETSSRG